MAADRERCLFDGLTPDEHEPGQLARCVAAIYELVPNPADRVMTCTNPSGSNTGTRSPT
jgi:hypothetical protein